MIPIGMYVALDYVWDKAREDVLTKKAIIMDEGWKLIGLTGSKDSAKFVLNVFKLIRGFNRSGIIASQDLNDFLTANGGEFGRGIINNSEIQTEIRTKDKELSIDEEALNLTGEGENGSKHRQGQGFLMVGSICFCVRKDV